MAVLSKQFTNNENANLRVGTPPTDGTKPLLSRKVYSDFDLSKLARPDAVQSFTDSSLTSGFSGAGDALPDELSPTFAVPIELTANCDAFVALRVSDSIHNTLNSKRLLTIHLYLQGAWYTSRTTKRPEHRQICGQPHGCLL